MLVLMAMRQIFKISLTGNDGYAPLQWYTISATGANTSNPSLTKSENGYVLDGR